MEGGGTAQRSRSRARRCAEAVVFVALLVAIGEVLHLGIYAYLLLTIPAVVAFKLLVAGRRLEELWVRDGPRLGRGTIILWLAFVLSVVPLVTLFTGHPKAGEAIYLVAALVGAIGASYAIRNASRSTLRCFGGCMLTAGLIGTLLIASNEIVVGIEHLLHGASAQPSGLVSPKPLLFLQQWAIIFPVAFVMEEVTFRGAVDSHVHRPGERHGVLSAIFVSLLWALWHLPTLPDSMPIAERLVAVLPLQLAVGPFLSLWWRRSGNLAVTSGTHSFLDSVRNALGIAP